MKKRNALMLACLFVILLVVMSACSNSSDDALSSSNQSAPKSTSQNTDDSSQSNESPSDSSTTAPITEATENDIQDGIQDANTTDAATKVEGRKTEVLERLDDIQKELDALPEKEDADNGVTNAMKNYYGLSYEMYDKELNEIYALLKQELSAEIMSELKAAQLKWIEQKEKQAEEARLEFDGGTFEDVAWYISLYESTKERCYALVNDYMTD